MILRRFTKHIKEQNWFAVGLDVIVVIVGIFLGMQVTNWQAERNDLKKAQTYLENLNQNLLQDIAYHNKRIETLDSLLSDIAALSEELHKQDNDSKEVKNILNLLLSTHRVRLETTTIENLKSTGNLDLITNGNLTEQLLKYYIEVDGNDERWYQSMSEFSRNVFGPYLMEHYSIDYSLTFHKHNRHKNLTIGNLREDAFLINAFAFRERALITLRGISEVAITRANEMITLIN